MGTPQGEIEKVLQQTERPVLPGTARNPGPRVQAAAPGERRTAAGIGQAQARAVVAAWIARR